MRADGDVIGFDINGQNSSQVSFVKNDEFIQTFASECPLHAFAIWILPWTPIGGSNTFDAECSQ